VALADGAAPAVGARQEQDGLLDVRREEQEVPDLSDAGAGHVGQPRQVGVVGDLVLLHHLPRSAPLPEADLRGTGEPGQLCSGGRDALDSGRV
jgi:hypothetical protein